MTDTTFIVLNPFTNDTRVLKEARTLVQSGHRLKIIALHEGKLPLEEERDGIHIYRIQLKTRSWSKKKPIQLIKYFEFVGRVLRKHHQADIFHCHDLNALPIGVLAKLLSRGRSKLVYDAHEYEINDGPNDSALKIKLKYYLEKLLIRFSDAVITVSNSIANEYVRLYRIPKPYLVLNTPPLQEVKKQNRLREALGIGQDTTVFLYQGGLSHGRGIELILEAFTRLPEKTTVIFMGYGILETHIRQYADRYANIYYHPAVDPDVLLDYTASADFGILFYENNCLNHEYCSPNKIFEYIMAGLPVIVSNLVEMRSLVTQYKVGVVTERNDADALIHAIEAIQKSDTVQFQKSLDQAKQKFCWAQQEIQLRQAYQKLNIPTLTQQGQAQ